ncbi:unnamed protein product [Dibothriocephalus latus]|uniref:Uncharacterized protein n=1 Tax=Dibothriocephalus latus TaxID=60516 RepID=A0A3P7M179_DIBLA|nr:unnamed protein product [Dibothriocephalus latus]
MRKMRSYLARLISGAPAVTSSSSGQQPLLPLTFSPVCKSPKSPSRRLSISFSKTRSAAGGTSLLVVAFMILAWATIIPLPDLKTSGRSLNNPSQRPISPNPPFTTDWPDEPSKSLPVQRREVIGSSALEDL